MTGPTPGSAADPEGGSKMANRQPIALTKEERAERRKQEQQLTERGPACAARRPDGGALQPGRLRGLRGAAKRAQRGRGNGRVLAGD
jgi:hypothetical protein